MKKTLLALSTTAALLLTSGCGGVSGDDKTAADSLAKAWNGQDAPKSRQASNKCIADKWVSAVGADALVEEKVVDKNFRAIGQAPPAKLGKESATAFGNAVADCFDIASMRDDLKKSMQGLDDKTLDAYIKCMDDIDRDLIAQAVRDGKINGATAAPTKATKDLQTVVQTCQEVVQK